MGAGIQIIERRSPHMRSAAASLWLSAVQVAAALFVGNLLAKRVFAMIYYVIAGMTW
jgi:hypothetical protein